ncbi:MAG: peptidylprolyl isomerase [Desulfobacterota bacterium]|nr:peptidylprolyl isomerase [Thermodesulfobacteriota bacterium]
MKIASFLSILICAAHIILPSHVGAEVIDRILATVNGEIITQSELTRYKTMLFFGSPEKPMGKDVDRQLLESLIERKLILQEAKKLEIEVKEKEIDAALSDILKRNNLTLAQLEAELNKQGLTLAAYRSLLHDEIMQSHVIGRQVHSKITITDKDVQDYYNQSMRQQEKKGPRVRIQQILLLIPKDATAKKITEIERTASSLRDRILAGEDFGALAAKYSQGAGAQQGGDLGYFYRGELMPELETAVFSLEPGQVSPVIKTELGFHIIKVIDRDASESDNASLQDRSREIRGILYGIEFEKRVRDYLEGLKAKAYIEIN